MYRIYNRESGWLIFQEKAIAALLGRLFSFNGNFRNLTISANGEARIDVHSWLHAKLPVPDAQIGVGVEYFVRTAEKTPRRINQNNTSYYCALLCLVSRSRETREALSVEIVTYELGDAHTKTRYVNAQEFYSAFQKRLFALIREEKELSGEQPTPA